MRDDLVPLLDRHMAEYSRKPFAWGVRDCVTFTAQWVKLATGMDLIPDGLTWSDKDSAQAALASMGCADTREVASRFLEPAPLLTARLGDIVGRDLPRAGFTLGICTGADVVFLVERASFARFGLTACHAAWKVDQCRQS